MPFAIELVAPWDPLEIKAADGEQKRTARASVTAYTGGQMNLPGFHVPVVIDLAGVAIPTQKVPMLRDHEISRIVGHTEAITVTSQRIKVDGPISGIDEDASQVLALAANGFPWQASVGMSVEAKEYIPAGQLTKVNGRNFAGPIFVARRTTLKEVSFVALGADVNSAAVVAAKHGKGNPMFEEWLTAKGFSEPATLTEAQTTSLRAMFDAEQSPPTPTPTPAPAPAPAPYVAPVSTPTQIQASQTIEQIQAAGEAEDARCTGIRTLVAERIAVNPGCSSIIGPLGKTAIEAKWSVDRTRQEIELAEYKQGFQRPTGVYVGSTGRDAPMNEEVITAALCMAGKLPGIDKHFDDRTLTAASRKWKHGLGLEELLVTTARRNGHDCNNVRDTKPVLRAAFAEPMDIRAASPSPSTYSLPTVLANTANKFMAAGFGAVDQAWRRISAINPVNDFKTKTGISLTTGALMYDKVVRGGELKHGTIGELTYTNAADTYGRTIAIDRRDLINDDLGVLAGLSRGMGRGAGLKLNDIFWTTFLNNTGSFFTSGHANITTGALSLTTLATTDSIFRVQTDADGMPTGLIPKILLVPPASRINALNLMNSTLVVSTTTANTPLPASNVLAGAYEVVSSPYMANSAYTGYSTTAYYLLADPADMPVIEVVFLNGVETPTIETADADFNILGIAMRAYLDAGVALQEYRAGVRSTGA